MGVVIALLLAGLGAALGYGTWRWRTTTAAAIATLSRRTGDVARGIVDDSALARVPAPVARYFRTVLRNGQREVRSARIAHEGQFRMGEPEEGWRPFVSTEVFGARPPWFVWDATIRMGPGVRVYVRDRYGAGAAAMQAALFGLVPVVDARDRSELAVAALQRYLAEAVWMPTALLPSQGVRWEAIDARTATATLSDGGVTAVLEFRFDDAGYVTTVRAPARFREVRGTYVPTPWEGHFRSYEEYAGMRIPVEGEVAWLLSDRRLTYWKGRVVEAAYEFGD